MPLAVVDVLDGYQALTGWAFTDDGSKNDGLRRFLGYWTVSAVDKNPCDENAGQIDAGTSVSDLADALAAQELSTTTKPVPVTIGGRDGLYLELTAPTALDGPCWGRDGRFRFNVWVSSPGGGRSLENPGQIDKIWIIDTERGRVVFIASSWNVPPSPGGSPAAPSAEATKNQELIDMVKSVRFVNPN
ncbi:MAG: hypothetical protein ABIM89_10155 [Mycobacteriales bacterium]